MAALGKGGRGRCWATVRYYSALDIVRRYNSDTVHERATQTAARMVHRTEGQPLTGTCTLASPVRALGPGQERRAIAPVQVRAPLAPVLVQALGSPGGQPFELTRQPAFR